MNEPGIHSSPKGRPGLAQEVGSKAKRKLAAQRDAVPGLWLGLGMMGLVGWSVAVPTLLGTALGLWLDRHYPSTHSWTLALLVAGLVIGCANAWHWVHREHEAIRRHQEDDDA